MEDMFDKDITILNRCFNKRTKKAEYKVSYVKGFWSSSNGISMNGVLLLKEDSLTARILMSEEGYQTPENFNNEINKLTVEEVNSASVGEINSLPVLLLTAKNVGWTLQKGDYLVKGKIEDFTSIHELSERHQEVMKITNIAIRDYGSEDMWHFAVTGG